MTVAARSFRHRAVFTGANVREAVADGRADYVPVFLSEIPRLIYSGLQKVDVALIHVSPPDYHERAYVMLHKPAGTECSQKPSTWPSIYTLLPAPLRQRPQKGAVQGVQAVGRLDQDTTGLLLLTDDGQFIHRMGSPRHHVPKVYEVTVKHPLDDAQVQRLLQGVVLDDDPAPVAAAACEAVSPLHLRLTLTEGKYHQVKRMVAAVGNRVEALHRSRMGDLELPAELVPGQWRWLIGVSSFSVQ